METKNIWMMDHYIKPPSVEDGYRHNCFAKYLKNYGWKSTLFFSSELHRRNMNLIEGKEKFIVENTEDGTYVAIKTRSYYENGFKRVLNMFDYFFGIIKNRKKFVKLFGRPDVIIASSVHPLTCIAGLIMAKKYKCKCIVEIKDLWPEALVQFGFLKKGSMISRVLYGVEKWIYKKSDSIIFSFEGGKDYIEEKKWVEAIPLSKVNYINNGIELDKYIYNLKKFKLEDDDLNDDSCFKVIYVGSIGKANAIDQIIDAAVKLKEYKDIKFYIYGSGNYFDKIKDDVLKYDLESVYLKGRIDKKFIPYILSQSDLNIITGEKLDMYKYGISPRKLLDYLASGKPIISSLVCGYDVLEKYNCGMTLEKNLHEGIQKFYNMKKYDYDEYCNRVLKVSQEYDYEVLTEKLNDVVNNTLGG